MTASTAIPENQYSGKAGNDAADTAYHVALNLILRGEVKGGEWLREESLAQLSGVSRTPVRQAINRLSTEGVVSLSRNKGAQVVSLTDGETKDLLSLRSKFEPYAAGLAVEHLSSEDLGVLAEAHEQMSEQVRDGAVDPIRMGQLNNDFHAVFIHRCGSTYLTTAVQSLVMPALVARTYGRYSPEALHRSMRHHQELLEAATAGDSEWVESAMRTHILAARHALRPEG